MADEAIAVADRALEVLDGAAAVVVQSGEASGLLLDGMRSGLLVGKDICERYLAAAAMQDPRMLPDVKLARLASDTAGWMCRLGARVAEGAYRAKRDDALGLLLQAIREEKNAAAKKE